MRPGPRGIAYLFARHEGDRTSRARTIAIKLERARRRDAWRFSLRRRLPTVDRTPLVRPIFVLGLQGGGTTLITRCLLRHPAAVSMSGNSSYWVATDELGFVRNRMRRLPKTLWSSAHRDDLEHPIFGTEHASVYACDELLPLYRNTAEDATGEHSARLRRLLKEHLAVYARDPSAARFVDKTHTFTLKVPYLDALLAGSEPCFVLVLRNPFTTCYRAVRRKPPSWRSDLSYDEQLALVAEHWDNSYRLALEDGARTGRFVAVRFEDFVRAPEPVIRSICDVAGLDFDDDLVPREEHRLPFGTLPWDGKWFPLHADRWRAHVGPREEQIVAARCGELAAELGYGVRADTAPANTSIVTVAA